MAPSKKVRTPEKPKSVFSGVFILLCANIVVKVIGLVFKIPISYILTDEGMGYYNTAYTVYAWLYVLSSAGVPVALSILVSGALTAGRAEDARVYRRAGLLVFGCLGALGSILLLVLAAPLARLVGAPGAALCLAAIAPTLFFVCVSAVLRGFAQGHRDMVPTSLSQVAEAVGKLFPGLYLARRAARKGESLPVVAAWAAVGVSVGAFFSMLYLLLDKRRYAVPPAETAETHAPSLDMRGAIRRILRVSFPVTVSSSVMSLSGLIDLSMTMRRLTTIGYTATQATALYGNYTTLVMPLFNLPSVFVYPIAYALVPEASALLGAGKREEVKHLAAGSMKAASWLGLPCALGLGLFAEPILTLIFRPASAHLAAPYLAVIAPGVFFVCLMTVTNALLQAGGYQKQAMYDMLIGCAVKSVSGFILLGIPSVGMMGAPIGTLLCYLTVASLHLWRLGRLSGTLPSFDEVFRRPMMAAVLSVVPARLLFSVLGADRPQATLLCLALAAFLWGGATIALGIFSPDEWSRVLLRLPFGRTKNRPKPEQ